MSKRDFALVGLGNPGAKYADTRHNIGFMFLDWLADRHGLTFSSDKHQSLSVRMTVNTIKIHLIKPQTYMNRSGFAVSAFCNYFDLDLDRVLVVHDDIDMHLGRIKLVKGGGAGGHNGIRSLIKELPTSEFLRLKIGVGRPGSGDTHPDMDVDKYVLAKFASEERAKIQAEFAEIEDGISFVFRGDFAKAQTCLNAIK